jgi:Arc-like DNA binding domain
MLKGLQRNEPDKIHVLPVVEVLKWCYSVAMERHEPIVSTNTRYPRQLHDTLLRLAREHRRSFNAEVMWALQRYVHQEEANSVVSKETSQPRVDGTEY